MIETASLSCLARFHPGMATIGINVSTSTIMVLKSACAVSLLLRPNANAHCLGLHVSL